MAELVAVPAARLALLEAWTLEAEARDWLDGDWDCLMAPCHWALTLTGTDPAAPWRGRYHSSEAALANLAAGGGMTRLVDRTLRPLGWTRTADPQPGAFGVITMAEAGRTRFGAVRYGDGWSMATRDGQLFTQGRARGCWNPPPGY